MDVSRGLRRQSPRRLDALDRAALESFLSNKGILPLLWAMFPDHPNLLPAYFDDDPAAAKLGTSYVRKPIIRARAPMSRWSATAARWPSSRVRMARKASSGRPAPLPNFSDQYPVLGSWLVDDTPCGLSVREDENPITGNLSRFVPHAIL